MQRIANSVDPDQTVPLVWSGSAPFAQAYLSKNRIIMVLKFLLIKMVCGSNLLELSF